MRLIAWLAVLSAAVLSGCGGGGGGAGSGGSAGPVPPPAPHYTARLLIDLESRTVSIQPEEGRATFGPGAISVSSSLSLVDPAELNRYRLLLGIDGRSDGRLILDDLSGRLLTLSDHSKQHQVSTILGRGGTAGDVSGSLSSVLLDRPTAIGGNPSSQEYWVADRLGRVLWVDKSRSTVVEVARLSLNGSYVASLTLFDRGLLAAVPGQHVAYLIRQPRSAGGAVSVFEGVLNTPGSTDGLPPIRLTNPLSLSRYSDQYVLIDSRRVLTSGLNTNDNPDSWTQKVLNTANHLATSLPTFRQTLALSFDSRPGIQLIRTDSLFGVFGAFETDTVGGALATGYAEGDGSTARFGLVRGLATKIEESSGDDVYVSDSSNHRIRRIIDRGVGLVGGDRYRTVLLAGTGVAGYRDGLGSVAQFNNPHDITATQDRVYVADTNNHVIREVKRYRNGILADYDNVSSQSPQPIGTPEARYLPRPGSVLGTPYYDISSGSVEIQLVTPQGVNMIEATITIEAPEPFAALDAVLNPTTSLAGSNRTHVRTHAGRYLQFGYLEGDGAAALFGERLGICVDASGVAYIADTANGVIRMLDTSNRLRTIMGDPNNPSTTPVDGDGTAELGQPNDIACSPDGTTLWWTDQESHVIRKATRLGPGTSFTDWQVSTIFGSAGSSGAVDGVGATARLNQPRGIAYDPLTGALYVADTGNHRIRRFLTSASPSLHPLQTIAGSSPPGYLNGAGSAAKFSTPFDVAVNHRGDIIVADTGNSAIRRLTPDGATITLAGSSPTVGPGSVDATTGGAARLNQPRAVAVDKTTYIYVADQGPRRLIRRVSVTTGETKTVAGTTAGSTATDGTGDTAGFGSENIQMAMNGNGDLWVAGGGVVRQVTRIIQNP